MNYIKLRTFLSLKTSLGKWDRNHPEKIFMKDVTDKNHTARIIKNDKMW